MQLDDSPDDTVLPIRTTVLANQLRELLQTFNEYQQTQHQVPTTHPSEPPLAPPPAQSIFTLHEAPSVDDTIAYRPMRSMTRLRHRRGSRTLLSRERPKSLNTVESLVVDGEDEDEYDMTGSRVDDTREEVFTCDVDYQEGEAEAASPATCETSPSDE